MSDENRGNDSRKKDKKDPSKKRMREFDIEMIKLISPFFLFALGFSYVFYSNVDEAALRAFREGLGIIHTIVTFIFLFVTFVSVIKFTKSMLDDNPSPNSSHSSVIGKSQKDQLRGLLIITFLLIYWDNILYALLSG